MLKRKNLKSKICKENRTIIKLLSFENLKFETFPGEWDKHDFTDGWMLEMMQERLDDNDEVMTGVVELDDNNENVSKHEAGVYNSPVS